MVHKWPVVTAIFATPPSSALVGKCVDIHAYMDKCLLNSCGKCVALVIESPGSSGSRVSGSTSGLIEISSSWCKVGSNLRKDVTFFTNLDNLVLPGVCCRHSPCVIISAGDRHCPIRDAPDIVLHSLPAEYVRAVSKAAICKLESGAMPDHPIGDAPRVVPSASGEGAMPGHPIGDVSSMVSPPGPPVSSGVRMYEVESIISHMGRGPKRKYKVMWKGYTDPTWETSQRLCKSTSDS